jgi:hypothetical protein
LWDTNLSENFPANAEDASNGHQPVDVEVVQDRAQWPEHPLAVAHRRGQPLLDQAMRPQVGPEAHFTNQIMTVFMDKTYIHIWVKQAV